MKDSIDTSAVCPVETNIGLIGSKWKILIIRNLMQRPWRFNELQRGESMRPILMAMQKWGQGYIKSNDT